MEVEDQYSTHAINEAGKFRCAHIACQQFAIGTTPLSDETSRLQSESGNTHEMDVPDLLKTEEPRGDLIERLRAKAHWCIDDIYAEAADELERLTAQRDEARKASDDNALELLRLSAELERLDADKADRSDEMVRIKHELRQTRTLTPEEKTALGIAYEAAVEADYPVRVSALESIRMRFEA